MLIEVPDLLGLPAHPLLVHAMVVLVPLVATGVLVAAVSARWRERLALPVLALAGSVVLLFPFVAGSGEVLEGRVRETELVERHSDLGVGFLWFALALLVAAGIVTWLARRHARPAEGPDTDGAVRTGRRSTLDRVVSVVAVVLALVATARIVQIGHSGSEAVWADTPAEFDD